MGVHSHRSENDGDMSASSHRESAERRVVTALFADVVGSTTLAESMDPEDWSDIVNSTVAAMAACINRFGGTVAHFAGDAILALFGAPTAHEDDPYRAVRAGLDIIGAVHELSAGLDEIRLQVRVGINTGLVVVGDIEAGALNVYSALGDTPNVAARLQTLAEPDTVLISEDTYGLVSNDVDVREIGPTELKGKTDAVGVYEVMAARGFEARRRGVPGFTSPMVGRDAELEILQELLAAAKAGTGRVAAIVGDPGVGKSRLVEELDVHVKGRGVEWALGRCVPYDDELPYHLIASLVRSLAGVTDSDDPDVAAKAVVALSESTLGTDNPATDHLLRLLGLSSSEPGERPELLHAHYSDALIALLTGLSSDRQPVVLVCEDVHWADASSVELMPGLLHRIQSNPILMVLVMRPDRESNGWGVLEHARRNLAESLTEIQLSSLDDGDSRLLVANLLEIESLPHAVRQMVLDKAEGNPFFLEEVVRMLVERDLVENRDGRWIARPGIDALDVPATVQGLLASRVDRLPADVRRAGRTAAVIGRQFPARLLSAVHPVAATDAGPAPTLHPHIADLEARGMVRLMSVRPELEFTFRHALIQDVMYEGLLKRERRVLHGEVAQAIERLYPKRLDELSPVLARHHTKAGNTDDAIAYLLTAGRLALERGARTEAHGFYAGACALLDTAAVPEPALKVEAAIGRAKAGIAFTPGPENIAGLEAVLPAAEELGDPNQLADLYTHLIWIRNMSGENYGQPAYRQQLDAGYAQVPQLTDPGTKALLQGMMGQALRSADEYAGAILPLTEAVDGLERADRSADASLNATMLGDVQASLGNFAEADAAVTRARELGEVSGDPNMVLDADLVRGRVASERGDLEEALIHTRRGLVAADEVGNIYCSLFGNFLVADQKLRLGEPEEAISHLERSSELAQYCNAGGLEALGQAWLAAARASLGDLDPAEFDAPLARAIDGGSRSGEAAVRLHRAIAVAGAAQPERSFKDFERAVVLFKEISARPNLARTHHAYGQALEAAGRGDDAAAHLREAERLFADLGIEPDPVAA
jgi:class 3 adenylate cyclase/tetratricopeptide (TPR) repeat protein